MNVPEITIRDLAAKLKTEADFILLDVREPWELARARLADKRLIALPLSVLARQLEAVLPEAVKSNRAAEILVMCHHGHRSADVTGWLLQQGWTNVRSVRGGIDAYAVEIDKTVGLY